MISSIHKIVINKTNRNNNHKAFSTMTEELDICTCLCRTFVNQAKKNGIYCENFEKHLKHQNDCPLSIQSPCN